MSSLTQAFKILPFTYPHIIQKLIPKTTTILDVGCGEGKLMEEIKRKGQSIVGIDLHLPSIKEAKSLGIFDDVIICDALFLPFTSKTFDVVICSQVIEHLPKIKGVMLTVEIERVSKQRVILCTPNGFMPQYEKCDELKRHKSGWSPKELKDLDYTIRGQGAKFLWGRLLNRSIPSLAKILISLISYIFQPLVYFTPKLAVHLICWKDVK